MITHFADLRLKTVSILGVKQVYVDRLHIPMHSMSEDHIALQLTPHTQVIFEEVNEPISPAHFAIQVPYSTFYESANHLKNAGITIVNYEDGRDIDDESGRRNLYFRDGDGNLGEIIAHDYVDESVLSADGPLQAMYLREVGLPVPKVPIFREWLTTILQMETFPSDIPAEQERFRFVVGGTAHAVVVSQDRPWIPIAMKALRPNLHITFGTPNIDLIQQLSVRWGIELKENEITFELGGYSLGIRYTPDFDPQIPSQLQLPLSKDRDQ